MKKISNIILSSILVLLTACGGGGGSSVPVSTLPTIVTNPTVDPEQTNANQGNDPTDPSTTNQQTDPTDPADPNQGNQQTDSVDPNGGSTDPANDPGNQNQGNDPATDPTDPNQGSNDPVNDPTDPNSGNQQTDPTDPVDPNQGNGGSNDPVTPVLNVVDYKQDYANSSALTKVILSGSPTEKLIDEFYGKGITDEYRKQFIDELRENDKGEYVYFSEVTPRYPNPSTDENGNTIKNAHVEVYGGNAVGLSYFDFGYWKSSIQTRNANGDLIDEKVTNLKVDYKQSSTTGTSAAVPTKDLVFTGKTYATIKDSNKNTNQIVSGDATLIRNHTTGDAEFYVRFNNWYDVAVTRNPDPKSSPLSYDFIFTKGANYQDNGYDFEGTKRGDFFAQYRGNREVTESGGQYYVASPTANSLILEGVFRAKR